MLSLLRGCRCGWDTSHTLMAQGRPSNSEGLRYWLQMATLALQTGATMARHRAGQSSLLRTTTWVVLPRHWTATRWVDPTEFTHFCCNIRPRLPWAAAARMSCMSHGELTQHRLRRPGRVRCCWTRYPMGAPVTGRSACGSALATSLAMVRSPACACIQHGSFSTYVAHADQALCDSK